MCRNKGSEFPDPDTATFLASVWLPRGLQQRRDPSAAENSAALWSGRRMPPGW